jgi:hypothetical protein
LAATSKKNTITLRGGGGSTSAISAAGPAAIPGVGLKSVFTKKHNSTASPANQISSKPSGPPAGEPRSQKSINAILNKGIIDIMSKNKAGGPGAAASLKPPGPDNLQDPVQYVKSGGELGAFRAEHPTSILGVLELQWIQENVLEGPHE